MQTRLLCVTQHFHMTSTTPPKFFFTAVASKLSTYVTWPNPTFWRMELELILEALIHLKIDKPCESFITGIIWEITYSWLDTYVLRNNLSFVGLAKILKKYDKRTGALLRLPFIQKILEQPFFTTDLISKLVKECEGTIDAVFPVEEEEERKREVKEAITVAGEGIFRNTVAALLTMQEIRRGSSTYSHYSLPPLNLPADSDLIHLVQLNPPIPIV